MQLHNTFLRGSAARRRPEAAGAAAGATRAARGVRPGGGTWLRGRDLPGWTGRRAGGGSGRGSSSGPAAGRRVSGWGVPNFPLS